jgi:ketosteroid isomerase-like protein
MTETDTAQFVARFFDAIEAGDIDAVAACYADDVVIWHNTDGLSSSKAENLQVLAGFVKHTPFRRYEDRRVAVFPGGFVQQHVLKSARRDGSEVALHAAIVCAVKDGRITRLDEYFDSAELAAWRA